MDTANGLNGASRIKIEWLSRLSLRKAHSDKGTVRENSCNAFFNLSSEEKNQIKPKTMKSQGYALSERSWSNGFVERGLLLNKREKVNVSNGKLQGYPINYTCL